MSGETVLVETRDGIATVTLNRPEVRNALNPSLLLDLERALISLEADPAARVIVLRGAGDKAFSRARTSGAWAIAAPRSRRASPSAVSRASWRPWRGCGRR